MIKYITVLNENSIILDLAGRKKEFFNNQEVFEDIYTRVYSQYFKRIGVVEGYLGFLNKPVFIPDPIKEFVEKEEVRKTTKTYTEELPQEVDIDEIVEVMKDIIIDNENNDIKEN